MSNFNGTDAHGHTVPFHLGPAPMMSERLDELVPVLVAEVPPMGMRLRKDD